MPLVLGQRSQPSPQHDDQRSSAVSRIGEARRRRDSNRRRAAARLPNQPGIRARMGMMAPAFRVPQSARVARTRAGRRPCRRDPWPGAAARRLEQQWALRDHHALLARCPPRSRDAVVADTATRGRVALARGIAGCGRAQVLARNADAKSYPSARITRVSGWTPSCFIASAAESVCMNS